MNLTTLRKYIQEQLRQTRYHLSGVIQKNDHHKTFEYYGAIDAYKDILTELARHIEKKAVPQTYFYSCHVYEGTRGNGLSNIVDGVLSLETFDYTLIRERIAEVNNCRVNSLHILALTPLSQQPA